MYLHFLTAGGWRIDMYGLRLSLATMFFFLKPDGSDFVTAEQTEAESQVDVVMISIVDLVNTKRATSKNNRRE